VKIEGVTVYNPLPARAFVDLDKECVVPIGGDIHSLDVDCLTHDIDDIQMSGRLPNGIHWGRTNRNENGFADILIDSAEVTEETLRLLIHDGIVTRP
jgi:hypothetical protein